MATDGATSRRILGFNLGCNPINCDSTLDERRLQMCLQLGIRAGGIFLGPVLRSHGLDSRPRLAAYARLHVLGARDKAHDSAGSRLKVVTLQCKVLGTHCSTHLSGKLRRGNLNDSSEFQLRPDEREPLSYGRRSTTINEGWDRSRHSYLSAEVVISVQAV